MPLYKPSDLYPSSDIPHGARAEVILGGTVSENDIVIPNAMSSRLMQVIRADADAILTSRGFLWVALENGVSGEKIEVAPWRVVRNVVTTGATVGDPVFLSGTAGGWTLTEPTAADGVVIGEVLVVSATVGVVALAPNTPFGSDRAVRGLADPGTGVAITLGRASASVPFTVAAGVAETNTLAAPSFQGQKLHLVAATVGAGGSRAVTVASAVNQTGNTIMTFAQANDWILLEGIRIGASLFWRIAANDGVALS